MLDMTEIKGLIEAQGKAFEAFKETHATELKKADAVTQEKLTRIEASLDKAVEAKASLEAQIEAERKEREDLELRMSRLGAKGDDTAAVERKAFAEQIGVANISEPEYAAYKSGFSTYIRKGEKLLDGAEAKAMSVGGDPDGGYLVTPDVTGRIVKRVYETSPIRQIANVQAISGDKLEGLEDLDEAAAGWVAEQGQRTDTATPQIGKYTIEAFELYGQPKATQKLLDDAAVDIEMWLAGKLADKFSRVENAAFVNGTGAGQPRGITMYPVAADSGSGVAWGSVGFVKTGVNGGFAATNPADNVLDVVGLLKDAYLPDARFVTRRSVITAVRKFKATDGHYLWQPSLVLGQPEQLAGYPLTRAEDMPALGPGSLSLAFGAFKEAYTVVDRLGVRTLRDPYTDKPYVKFYSIKRTGGGLVNFEAIKFLQFAA